MSKCIFRVEFCKFPLASDLGRTLHTDTGKTFGFQFDFGMLLFGSCTLVICSHLP